MINIYIFASVLIVSLASLSGVFLLSLCKALLQKIVLYLLSFATGALFANVFLHLLPEMVERTSDVHASFALVLTGILLSFLIERFIHWHHCHNLCCSEPVGTMMLIGDGMHNITDGILIAAAYLVDVQLGIATTLAIVLHEIPQEIGDFAVLIHSGWSRKAALLANLLSAFTAFLGAMLVIVLHEKMQGMEMMLLPITAGNFLYIAGSDLIPILHKEAKLKNSILQFLSMLLGILLMYMLFTGEHSHGHEHDNDHPEHQMHEVSHDDHKEHDQDHHEH